MESDVQKTPTLTLPKIVNIVLLIVILLAIPVTVILLGQRTRQQIKAGVDCKTPFIPDPSDCVGGDWKLYKNEEGCIRFRCVPQ